MDDRLSKYWPNVFIRQFCTCNIFASQVDDKMLKV